MASKQRSRFGRFFGQSEDETYFVGGGQPSFFGIRSSTWRVAAVIFLLLLAIGVIALLAFLLRRGAGGGGGGNNNVHSTSTQCLRGYARTPDDIVCKVAIIGTGPSGLFAGFRLAEQLGNTLCLIDERDVIGGRVQSVEAPQSTAENPLFAPTHGEQFQSHHTRARCLGQQFQRTSYIRSGFLTRFKYYEFLDHGFNVTSVCERFDDLGNGTIVRSLCASFSIEEKIAPNGIPLAPEDDARYPVHPDHPHGLPRVCPDGLDYTECSYGDEITFSRIFSPTDSISPENYATFADYVRDITASPQAAIDYFFIHSGVGYILTPPAYPVQGLAGFQYLEADFFGPAAFWVWPRGGPNMILRDMAESIEEHGARFFMEERAECFDRATDAQATQLPWVIRTDKRNVRAERVVWAIPAGSFQEAVKGTLGQELSEREEMKAVGDRFPQCSIDLFFDEKWWLPERSQITDLHCVPSGDDPCVDLTVNDTVGANVRDFVEWTFYEPDSGFWMRYMPTPDIQEMNLLRILPDHCEEWNDAFLQRGLEGVRERAMQLLRLYFLKLVIPNPDVVDPVPQDPTAHPTTIPEPLAVNFTYERQGFSHFQAESSATIQEVLDFARTPLGDNDRVCFASESFQWVTDENWAGGGWIEGAFEGATECFEGPALEGFSTAEERTSWGRCSNSQGAELSFESEQSSPNRCLFLDNETPIFTLAGVNYCPQGANSQSASVAREFIPKQPRTKTTEAPWKSPRDLGYGR